MNSTQKGSALISVLIILLVITVLGVVAIRQGLTSLNISTANQVGAVLFQSADYGIDQVYINLNTKDNVIKARTPLGMIGSPQLSGNELVICLTSGIALTPDLLGLTRLSENRISGSGALENLGTTGYCSMDSNDYSSSRNATITQLALLVPKDRDTGTPFSTSLNGTDHDVLFGSNSADATNGQSKPVRLRVYATSIAPALSQSTSNSTINDCLKKFNDASRAAEIDTVADQETVTDCLTKEGVPFSTHTEDYLQRPSSTRSRNN